MFLKNEVCVYFCIKILKFLVPKGFEKSNHNDNVALLHFIALLISFFIFKSSC